MNKLSLQPQSLSLTKLTIAGVVSAFASVLLLGSAPVAAAGNARFSLSPAESQATGSDGLSLTVYADSGDIAVNAVEPDLRYDPSQLQLENVSGDGSTFDVAAPVANEEGSVRIPRGKIQPGVTGRQKVATVKFRVIGSTQSAAVTFGDKSSILTLDNAANIWNGQAEGGRYMLSQPVGKGGAPELQANTYPIAIIVQDKKGEPVQGAAVSLGNGRTATTDAKGVAGFMNVPEGQYDATVTNNGETAKRSVNVQKSGDNKVQEHAFTLAASNKKLAGLPTGLLIGLVAVVFLGLLVARRSHHKALAAKTKKSKVSRATGKK